MTADRNDMPDLGAALASFRRALQDLERDADDLRGKREEELKSAQGCEDSAMHAVKLGRDDLAREALAEFEQHAEAGAILSAELEICESTLSEYRKALAELEKSQVR